MLLIYTPIASPRLVYSCNFLFGSLLSVEVEFTQCWEEFAQYPSPKLAYSPQPPADGSAWLRAAGLLFETQIQTQELSLGKYEGLTVLYQHQDQRSLLPFDLLAMAFYLLSRYEEYLPFEPDPHGRFSAKQSLAFKEGFLELPIINLLGIKLGQKLQDLYPQLRPQLPPYELLPSYDIDHLRAFEGKGFWRQAGALGKNLLSNRELFRKQIRYLFGYEPDMYEQFGYLEQLHQRLKLPAHFFFLCGDWGEYDKNLPTDSPIFKQTVAAIATKSRYGLHPSYGSHRHISQLQKEKNRLEQLGGETIYSSRQHFLKFSLPTTYRQLLEVGIREDYSLGFADHCGFRAGTNLPFLWFDLERGQATDLLLQPLIMMDVTLKNQLRLSPEAALDKAMSLAQTIKQYGGRFSTLFHNSSFCECLGWQGWKAMYEQFLEQARDV